MKYIISLILSLTTLTLLGQPPCPDSINNSPGNSGDSIIAYVYDNNGYVIDTFSCEQTGASSNIDCDLDNIYFDNDAYYFTIEIGNGNTNECIYDLDGDLFNPDLPIELKDFNVNKDGVLASNVIEWSTYTERNNDYFTIERSIDGINWTEITTVNGVGSTTEEQKYIYSDRYFERDTINYYRLKQTDYDGQYEYFDIESVDNRSNKKVKMILNTLGQEVDLTYKGIIIIMYDDGSSIKKYNH